MKITFSSKKLLITLTISIILILQTSDVFSHNHKKPNHSHSHSKDKSHKSHTHSHDHSHSHSHKNSHAHTHSDLTKNSYIGHYVSKSYEFLESKLANFSKQKQAYIGAFIVSSASVPVFLIIMLFNIKSVVILNTLSAFAAGALVGDVFLHNLPEIYEAHADSEKSSFFLRKETLLGFGLIFLFALEKIIKLLYAAGSEKNGKKQTEHKHETSHSHSCIGHGNSENIVLSIVGDLIHNVTDGLAIGAAYATSLKLGITLTLSIFFHEIPHEVGDFSFLLKQKLSKFKALSTQFFSAMGSFVGVYLNFLIGDAYSLHILSFASGAFLYLSINTILGDIKEATTIRDVITEMIAFILGFYVLYIII